MPWVLKRKDKAGFLTRAGHYDASPANAYRFADQEAALRMAPDHDVVADNVRAGVDYPCALHKGPKGDCKPWNCRCY